MSLVKIVFAPGDDLERTVTINGERIPVRAGMEFRVTELEAERLEREGFQRISKKSREGA